MGIDSLMAVELQIAINTAFGVELSALELTRGFSISQLTLPLLERMGLDASDASEGAGPRASRPAPTRHRTARTNRILAPSWPAPVMPW